MKKLTLPRTIYAFSFCVALSTAAYAEKCAEPTAQVNLDVNNVRALLLNLGSKFNGVLSPINYGYEIPKGSGLRSIFTAACMFSARDAGNNLHTAAQTYRQWGQEFWPGRLDANGKIDSIRCRAEDKIYSVYGSEINQTRAGGIVTSNMIQWGESKAPFFDKNGDGFYDPTMGDYPVLNPSHPEVIPGQMAWWVINDVGNTHTAFVDGLPLGIEVQVTAYAFESASSAIMNNSTMYRYLIQNKSINNYTDFRVGMFNDFDLGGADDDFIGCDISTNAAGMKRNLVYCYNSDNEDLFSNAPGYGIAPPAVGMMVLNRLAPGDPAFNNLGSYMYFGPNAMPGIAAPTNSVELERYLSGFWADGAPITYGAPTGRGGTDPCKYIFPGDTDPAYSTPWVETNTPGDRRTVAALAPKSLAAGEQLVVEYAYLWARSVNNIASREKLRLSADTLLEAHQNFYANFSTGVNFIKQEADLKVFPNPTNDYLRLDLEEQGIEVMIYSSEGKLVMRQQYIANQVIKVSELPVGTYYVKAGKYSGKFLKR